MEKYYLMDDKGLYNHTENPKKGMKLLFKGDNPWRMSRRMLFYVTDTLIGKGYEQGIEIIKEDIDTQDEISFKKYDP